MLCYGKALMFKLFNLNFQAKIYPLEVAVSSLLQYQNKNTALTWNYSETDL